MKPSMRSYFEYGGERFETAWFDVDDKVPVALEELNQISNYGEIGERMIGRAANFFNQK